MRTLAYRCLLVMVFTLPWENVVDLPGIGRVSRAVGLLVGLVWVCAVIGSGEIRQSRKFHVVALFFVLWDTLSLLWTVDGPATTDRVLTYVQLFALTLVFWDTVTTLKAVRATLTAYLLGSMVSALALLGRYAAEGAGSEVHGRVTVGNFHPNDVGLILAMGVPIAGYVATLPVLDGWDRARQVVAVAYVPVSAFAVLLTGSRASVGALLPGFVYVGYLLVGRRPQLAVGALVSMVVLIVLLLPLLPGRVALRLEGTKSAVESGGLNERAGVWSEAIRLIKAHPVVGIGAGAFRTANVDSNKVGHNFVLALLAEVGIVGFGLFAAMLVLAFTALRVQPERMRGMWIAVFLAWLAAASLHNWEYRKQTWFFLALMLSSGYLEDAVPETRQRAPAYSAARAP